MKKLKFILPVVAFVMAVGLSFAFNTENYQTEPEAVNISGNLFGVDANCEGGAFTCRVQLLDTSGNPIPGAVYPVFGYNADTGEYDITLQQSTSEPKEIPQSSLRPVTP